MAALVLACVGILLHASCGESPQAWETNMGVWLPHLCSRAANLLLVGHYSVAISGPLAKSLIR